MGRGDWEREGEREVAGLQCILYEVCMSLAYCLTLLLIPVENTVLSRHIHLASISTFFDSI